MNKFRTILVVLIAISAVTVGKGQKNFYGSIKFNIYAIGEPLTPLADSLIYSIYSNGISTSQLFESTPNLFFFDKTVSVDSVSYCRMKGEPYSLYKMKSGKKERHEAKPTQEFQDILGYRCQKFMVTRKSDNFEAVTESWWIATDLKLGGHNLSWVLDEYPGCPLKYELVMKRRDGKKECIQVREAVELRPTDDPFDLDGFLKGKSITTEDPFMRFKH